ncbi:MAG: peptidylprolyl isomerase [Bacteroidota bacterium]
MFTVRQALLLSITLFWASCSEQRGKEVLAEIDQYVITEAQVKDAFEEYYFKSGRVLKPDMSTKKEILKSELGVCALSLYARDNGVSDTEEAFAQKAMLEKSAYTEAYLKKELIDPIVITDKDLRHLFERVNTNIRASHLYAPTLDSARSLYERLENGEDFDELASEIFNHPYLANSGGDLGFFEVDEMDIAFEDEAYRLPLNTYSKPVQTSQGYSIIKVTVRNRRPILTEFEFSSAKNKLQWMAKKQEKERVLRGHMDDFIEEVELDKSRVADLWELFKARDMERSAQSIGANSDDVLAVARDEEFTTRDIYTELLLNYDEVLGRIRTQHDFSESLKATAYRMHLLRNAELAGITTQDEINDQVSERYTRYLAKEAITLLENQISVSEYELRKEFNRAPDLYASPLQMRLRRIAVSSTEVGEQVLAKLNNGENFTDLVKEYTVRNDDRYVDGDLGFLSIKDLGFNGVELSKLMPGDRSGVMTYQSNEYHIYECLDRIEPQYQGFEYVKDQVAQKVRQNKLRDLRKRTVDEMITRYDAFIDLKKLEELTIEL